jgi:hypothetical protein
MKSNQFPYSVGRSLLFLSWLLLLTVVPASSQNIIGKITGRNGAAISGASVGIVGTNNTSFTDSTGAFTLRANSGSVLEISSVG